MKMKPRFIFILFLALLLLLGALPAAAEEELPLKGVKIGIDPGHQRIYNAEMELCGPNTTKKKQKVAGGCVGCRSGVMEYEVNQNVGLYLKDLLLEAGAEVYITHETLDVNISNKERAEFFNEHEVDLGLRLHCNKASSESARGVIMLVPSEDCTEHFIANLFAAITIEEAYREVTGLPGKLKPGMLQFRDDQSGFNWCTRPVICIEMGYLSNPEDDALLSDPEFQKLMAQGIYEGVLRCFNEEGRLRVS